MKDIQLGDILKNGTKVDAVMKISNIDEKGNLGNQHLTKELMLEKHCLSKNWKHFGEDLRNLDIEEK